MEIRISGVGEYNKNNKYWSDYTISIIDNPQRFNIEESNTRLVLDAMDIKYENLGYNAPSKDHVLQALDFVKKNNPKKLAIHCKAGISRSTGIALAILYDQYRDCEKAFNELLRIRPQAFPNELIVSHIDTIYGLNGQMSKLLKNMSTNKIN